MVVVVLLVLGIGMVFGNPAKSVSSGDPMLCEFTFASCYLVKKVGPNVGAPSNNILPSNSITKICIKNWSAFKQICGKDAVISFGAGCRSSNCIDKRKCSCLALLKGMKKLKHPLVHELQKLINAQDGRKYHLKTPKTRVCARHKCKVEWWQKKCWCVAYKWVLRDPVVHPFRGNLKIGSVATLDQEEPLAAEDDELFEMVDSDIDE
eukprot:gene12276-5860_t